MNIFIILPVDHIAARREFFEKVFFNLVDADGVEICYEIFFGTKIIYIHNVVRPF